MSRAQSGRKSGLGETGLGQRWHVSRPCREPAPGPLEGQGAWSRSPLADVGGLGAVCVGLPRGLPGHVHGPHRHPPRRAEDPQGGALSLQTPRAGMFPSDPQGWLWPPRTPQSWLWPHQTPRVDCGPLGPPRVGCAPSDPQGLPWPLRPPGLSVAPLDPPGLAVAPSGPQGRPWPPRTPKAGHGPSDPRGWL